jgi:hypothetical protein
MLAYPLANMCKLAAGAYWLSNCTEFPHDVTSQPIGLPANKSRRGVHRGEVGLSEAPSGGDCPAFCRAGRFFFCRTGRFLLDRRVFVVLLVIILLRMLAGSSCQSFCTHIHRM